MNRIKRKIKHILMPSEKKEGQEQVLPRILAEKPIAKEKKIVHFSAFTYGNAGDAILPTNVEDAIEYGNEYSYNWKGIHAHKYVDDSIVEYINKSNGVIIGGGGLFLKDTNPNNNSGWQWNCSISQLQKINSPIALFAVGYNRFRNQPDFEPVFKEHLNLLVQKSVFWGLRNTGSIENVKNYLNASNHDKLRYQPCPTTIISRLYPDLVNAFKGQQKEEEKFIALNCAFDRSQLRFGEKIGEKLTSIARVIKELSKYYQIKYYSHMTSDNYFIPFLDSFGIKYKLVQIQTPDEIIREYCKPSLVIGMRGHSQMIPFGCKTPILSIVSHEKMGWFLQDIDKRDWGCEIMTSDFESELLGKALHILKSKDSIVADIETIQQSLLDVTIKNVNDIRKAFNI